MAEMPSEEAGTADGAAPSQPLSRQLLADYLDRAGGLLSKHTRRWHVENVHLGLGDEPPLARALARLLDGQECDADRPGSRGFMSSTTVP